MSGHFVIIIYIFIDIVYENFIFLPINLVIYDWKTNKLEVGTDLVQPACFRGGFDKGNFTKFGVGTCFEGFVFGLGRVSARDHGLANIDSAGLVFAQSVERLINKA